MTNLLLFIIACVLFPPLLGITAGIVGAIAAVAALVWVWRGLGNMFNNIADAFRESWWGQDL